MNRYRISRNQANSFLVPTSIFLFALIFRTYWRLNKGIVFTTDSEKYLASCGSMWSNPLSIFKAGKEFGVDFIGFTVPMCSVINLSGGDVALWVGVQVVLSAFTAVIVYWTGSLLVNRSAGIIAGLTFAILFETIRYSVFVLSETMFIFVLAVSLWRLAKFDSNPSRKNRLYLYLVLGWLAVTRPIGVPIVAGWLAYDLINTDIQSRVGISREYDLRLGILPTVTLAWVFFIGAILLLLVHLFTPPNSTSTVMNSWSNEWIFWGARNPWYFPTYPFETTPASSSWKFILINIHHIIALGLLRAGAFLVPALPRFTDNPYYLLNFIVMTYVIFFSMIGVIRIIKERLILFQLLVTPLLVMVLVVSVTFQTYWFRYRAPACVLFALFVGYAIGTSDTVRTTFDEMAEKIAT